MAVEEIKDRSYFAKVRQEIIAEVPEGTARVLDIGCGLGLTGRALKQAGKAGLVVGIECEPAIAEEAEANLDRVIRGDVETLALDFPPDSFDAILMGDVLEHLRDPWAALARLRPWLRPNGLLIITFPNISYWSIPFNLVFRDRFDYEAWGILDSMHLRFFTRQTLTRYLGELNFQVEKIAPTKEIRKRFRLFNFLFGRRFEYLFVFQYVLVARKKYYSHDE